MENPFIPGAAEGSYYARLAAAATVACRWQYRCPMMAASQGDDGGSAWEPLQKEGKGMRHTACYEASPFTIFSIERG